MTLVVTVLFTKDAGDPATGLTLADIDITLRSRLKADGTMANVWATQNPTEEIGGGLYSRALTGEDEATYDYFGFANYTGATTLDSDYSLYGGGPGLAAAIAADAVWNELSTGHVSAGKAGEQLWTDVDAVLAVADNLPDSGALNDLAAILADTGTTGVVIATATAQAIADEVLKRGVSNVEDSADATSLAALVLAAFESVIAGSVWTIYKTDHATTFATRTVTTDTNAKPIVEVT